MFIVSLLYILMLKYENCKIYLISVIEKKLCVFGKTMLILIRFDRKGNCKLKILCMIILWEWNVGRCNFEVDFIIEYFSGFWWVWILSD